MICVHFVSVEISENREREMERGREEEREVFMQTIKGTHWSLGFVELGKNVH